MKNLINNVIVMKKTLVIVALLATAVTGRAQGETGSWTLVPRVGFNFAKVTEPDLWIGENVKKKPSNKTGLVIGAEAEYQLNDYLSCNAGLFYSQQGSRYRDAGEFRNMKTTIDYLNVPLTVGVWLGNGLSLRSGIQVGYAINTKVEAEELYNGNWEPSDVAGDASWYRRWDVSLPVAVSFELQRIRVDLRYNIGLNYLTHYGDVIPERNRVLQLTVGYCLDL